MKVAISTIFYFVCALVAIAKAQDISMMFQALGMDAPVLPPTMPRSLREHLYPHQRMMKQKIQQYQQQQQRQMMAIRAAQLRESVKANPYSAPYNVHKVDSSGRTTLLSGANTIRRPGQLNTVSKINPYAAPNNPYSTSRAASSRDPAVRRRALAAARGSYWGHQDRRYYQTPYWSHRYVQPGVLATMKKLSNPAKKIKDAKMAGCKLPVDNTAASVLMFNTCRSQAAQMACQMELMQCMNVGMAAMCCPPGMNNLAMDTISYVNKLQQFVAEVA